MLKQKDAVRLQDALPPRAEHSRTDMRPGFLNGIPSQTPSMPCREQFPICLKHKNGVSLTLLCIIFPVCAGYEWSLSIFLSPICLGDVAVREGQEILFSLEESYFK